MKKKLKLAAIEKCNPIDGCCSPDEPFSKEPQPMGFVRRDFMKAFGVAVGGTAAGLPAIGSSKKRVVPDYVNQEKKIDQAKVKELRDRGEPEVFSGKDLVYIGMPVGGICAGQVYLGGEGRLWLWNIFNEQKEGVVAKNARIKQGRIRARDGANYVSPVTPESPFEQGFALQTTQNGVNKIKKLDYRGFEKISFRGQYPLAKVTYEESGFPVECELTAGSPFIPGDVESSSYPATIMQFKVTNVADSEVDVSIAGWLENAVMSTTGSNNTCQLKNASFEHEMVNGILSEAIPSNEGLKAFVIDEQPDYGSMTLALLKDDYIQQSLNTGLTDISNLFGTPSEKTESINNFSEQLTGSLVGSTTLEAGESRTFTFIVSWYFPNLYVAVRKAGPVYEGVEGRSYRDRFGNAEEISRDIASNFKYLFGTTKNWVQTFYEESTLPYWFLNRTFANVSTLATETSYLLGDGRFWGWEGVGCCPGTCTHVWHYAQAMGRVFPELERNLRERTDFSDSAFDVETGRIDFRGGLATRDAADGQAGIIMRCYREHQISVDNSFLQRNWSNIKLALNYLIDLDKEDGEANGMIFGEQHNTLDAEWYGNIPVITSLYLCALACGKEMADDMSDEAFKEECDNILSKGKKNIEILFDGEYFTQKEDPDHPDAIGIGPGCYIDQVFGQGWAFQLGLGRLYNEEMINKSLEALFKYNFMPDMGTYRASLPPKLAGRPYALDGDSGLVMCTWPKGGRKPDWEKHWQYGYFNECMTGFEYQAASHMMWEGMIDKSLTIVKAIHDRYHPAKRNPYNEIECSDHYARAMASYGVYVAICGFTYHGPKGEIGFAPKINPEDFQCAFTIAEGWGSYSQKIEGKSFNARLELKYGNEKLTSVTLNSAKKIKKYDVKVDGQNANCKLTQRNTEVKILFDEQLVLKDGSLVEIILKV